MAIKKDWVFRKGDMYMANMNPFNRSGQDEVKPVVVLQNNDGAFDIPTLLVAPLTIRVKEKERAATYLVKRAKGINHPFMIELEQVSAIDKRKVKSYIGKISRDDMESINETLERELNLYIPVSVEAP